MSTPPVTPESHLGARFFDSSKRDLGWAFRVSKRTPPLGGLIMLDVSTTEEGLAASLVALDNDRLSVEFDGPAGEHCVFAWASGYANGNQIRVQGKLE